MRPSSETTGSPGSVGVLLSNLGTPEAPTAAALRPYLKEFLSDRRVVEAPRLVWWFVLRCFILPFRPRRSARLYRAIWTPEGSPLLVTTRRLGERVAELLAARHDTLIPVAVGMRYGQPSVQTALRQLRDAGCTRILALALYPQYSATTSGSTMDAIGAELSRWRRVPELRTVLGYHTEPGYLDALARSIGEARREHGAGDHLLLSFHGIPRSYAERGDPYPEQCRATAETLAGRLELPPESWSLAYQSRFGPQEWVGPATDEKLKRLAAAGAKRVDVACPGFAVDCLETLEEIATGGAEEFLKAGGHKLHYIPALNDSSGHAEFLSELLSRNLGGWV